MKSFKMASCSCSNIEIMQIFYELKQKFPFVPDHIVSECILQNAHNKDLCENELSEENSRYLTHCFPQGLVDKMAEEEEEKKGQVYFERGYARRSLDSTQCARRKSSSGSEEGKHIGKISKKLSLGLPPKHAKRAYKHGIESLATMYSGQGTGSSSTLEGREKKKYGHHRKDKAHMQTIKMDHRGNLERYKKFDEIVAKEKYKKLDDITNTQQNASMSESEQHKLQVAQQMLGLRDDDTTPPGNSTNENKTMSRSQKVSPNVAQINLSSPVGNDHSISSNTRWNYQRSVSSYSPSTSSFNESLLPAATSGANSSSLTSAGVAQTCRSGDRGSLKLDLSPQQSFLMEGILDSSTSPTNQQVPHFHLSVPSSSGPCVSVLSYSAPTTPMSATPPMFPPLALDVHTGGHRTSLSLEPLPQYGFSEDPARPLTKVTLSLNPPGDDENLVRPNTSTSGLTYTSYSLKDGVQAQLHISIGSNMSPASSPIDDPTTSSHPHQLGESQQISIAAKNILNAQMERKAKLFNALMCERERLSAIKRDIASIQEKVKLRASVQPKPSKILKLQLEIKSLQQECALMTKACNSTSATPEGKEPPGWICYMCTFLNHHMLPKCEQCDMPRVNLSAC